MRSVNDRARLAHDSATAAAKFIIAEGMNGGLSPPEIAVACESAIAIVVASMAVLSSTPNPIAFASEMIDAMTERAHFRVVELLKSMPEIPPK